jgi:AraC-like DNA-binding protein
MSVLFRAVDEPEASRMDYWHHVVGDMAAPLDLRIPEELGGRDQLLVGELGAVRVAELSTGKPGDARRTESTIRRRDPGLCKIDVLVEGAGMVQQDGRVAQLGAGDWTFVDLSRPARWRLSPMRSVVMVLPRTLLPLSPDEMARLTAVRIPGDEGTGALMSSLARQLVERLDEHDAAEGSRLGAASIELLTAALASRLGRAERFPDAQRRALLVRIHAFIEEHLGDIELSPTSIADAHHISVRYLYKLFDSKQESVASWIRLRRLERCRRDLLDPALRARPVSAIAARWGLPNAAHFSRVFRATYGVSPAEFRALGNASVSELAFLN